MSSSQESKSVRKLTARPYLSSTAFSRLNPNRLDQIHLYDTRSSSSATTPWRYKLNVLDRDVKGLPKLPRIPCAVLLVPVGRESEFVFRTVHGLRGLAESADCARLIAVAFHRDCVYGNQADVQRELTPTVQCIAQRGEFLSSGKEEHDHDHYSNLQIPFLTVGGEGIGERSVVARGETETTGPYVVEEVKDDEDDDDTHDSGNDKEERFLRRLYFLRNPNVIQTEVYVSKPKGASSSSSSERFHGTRLAFEYHKGMCAGMVGLGFHISDTSTSASTTTDTVTKEEEAIADDMGQQQQQHVLVVGLGGGGLPNFLTLVFPLLHITVIELDVNIVHIARSFFGFTDDHKNNSKADRYNPCVSVVVGDGLSIRPSNTTETGNGITNDNDNGSNKPIKFPPASLDAIAIDVDAKNNDDASAMSCPPVSFVTINYLERLHQLLKPNGVLAINVSARDPEMLRLVQQNCLAVFPVVLQSSCHVNDDDTEQGTTQNTITTNNNNENEDLNVVVFAKKDKGFKLPSKEDKMKLLSLFHNRFSASSQLPSDDPIRTELEGAFVTLKEITVDKILLSRSKDVPSSPLANNIALGNTDSKKSQKKKSSAKKKKKGKRK